MCDLGSVRFLMSSVISLFFKVILLPRNALSIKAASPTLNFQHKCPNLKKCLINGISG